MNETDQRLLRRTIDLAHAARAAGQRPYGSLLAGPGGEVLAEDRNTVLADGDITAHPELKLARWAALRLDCAQARATTLYTSCEPCEMCRGAIARAQIGRVVFALSDTQWHALVPPDVAAAADEAPVYEGPALTDEAVRPVSGYFETRE
jgi:tRNA(Arg) A34 adenosine deaminase TadA